MSNNDTLGAVKQEYAQKLLDAMHNRISQLTETRKFIALVDSAVKHFEELIAKAPPNQDWIELGDRCDSDILDWLAAANFPLSEDRRRLHFPEQFRFNRALPPPLKVTETVAAAATKRAAPAELAEVVKRRKKQLSDRVTTLYTKRDACTTDDERRTVEKEITAAEKNFTVIVGAENLLSQDFLADDPPPPAADVF